MQARRKQTSDRPQEPAREPENAREPIHSGEGEAAREAAETDSSKGAQSEDPGGQAGHEAPAPGEESGDVAAEAASVATQSPAAQSQAAVAAPAFTGVLKGFGSATGNLLTGESGAEAESGGASALTEPLAQARPVRTSTTAAPLQAAVSTGTQDAGLGGEVSADSIEAFSSETPGSTEKGPGFDANLGRLSNVLKGVPTSQAVSGGANTVQAVRDGVSSPVSELQSQLRSAGASNERAHEIFRQVRMQLSPKTREATLELTPKTLGRIEVKVSLEEGRMRATLRVERAETLAALERYVPELRAALGAQQIETESFELTLGFEEQAAGSRNSGEENTPQERRSNQSGQQTAEVEASDEQVRETLSSALADGARVDTYV